MTPTFADVQKARRGEGRAPGTIATQVEGRSLGECIGDVDGGLYRDRFPFDEIRLVFPLLHSVEGGLLELLGARHNLELFDVAFFADDSA